MATLLKPASVPGLVPEVQPRPQRANAAFLVSILLLAVTLRVAWRIHMGSADFWTNGYSFFYDLANNLAAGHGLHIEGSGWAMRMPLYPFFLALTLLAGKSYLWIVIPQALMGAGTVACAFLIGRELFGESTGILASVLTAVYPYYVVHDTALQETGMFTLLTALSVFLLLRARRGGTWIAWASAGLGLGAAVLTRQTLAPFAVAALIWIGIFGVRPRLSRSLTVTMAFALTVAPWLVRNYFVIGAPVLTSEFGRQVWNANNAKTFSHYPSESIDRSADEAFAALTPSEQRELDRLRGNEIAESDWFLRNGLDYIQAHPAATLFAAFRKIAAGFSWRFNPAREPVVQAAYLASYGPISILGVLGMLLTRRQWREHRLIYALFLTFAGVTAVFFAHTSHRSFLDVYLIVFAACLIHRLQGKLALASHGIG